MGTSKIMLGDNPVMDKHPILGRVEILLVTSDYRNQHQLWPDRALEYRCNVLAPLYGQTFHQKRYENNRVYVCGHKYVYYYYHFGGH